MGNLLDICSGAKTEETKKAVLDPKTDREFHFRLMSKENVNLSTAALTVECLVNGNWERQQASFTGMPGFRQYLVSLVVCQHYYLVANAKERNIPIRAVEAECTITTGKDWIMKRFEGDFVVRLDPAIPKDQQSQKAKPEDLEYCRQRMTLCPVSKNLPPGTVKEISVRLADYVQMNSNSLVGARLV